MSWSISTLTATVLFVQQLDRLVHLAERALAEQLAELEGVYVDHAAAFLRCGGVRVSGGAKRVLQAAEANTSQLAIHRAPDTADVSLAVAITAQLSMSTPAPAPITPQASKGTLIRRLSSLEVQPKSELRGVRLSQLLWPFGAAGRRFRRIIDPADDSAAIAVPTIDCFISHAWADAWPLKYVALIYHFHADGAAACVVVLVFFAFFIENSLPELLPSGWPLWIPRASELDGSTHYVPQLCYFVAVVSFLPLMLLGRFVRDRVCFFDACCVPQDDKKQKAAGIESLGAIVSRSERLVVLVDENTFTRLWCLFEVASFTAAPAAADASTSSRSTRRCASSPSSRSLPSRSSAR